MAERDEILVIGGGAVGVCCAYELARAGRSVRLIERGELCAGCSAGNAGLVPTSVCGPIAEPGVIGKAMRWLRDPEGPLRIKVRADPKLVRWLWLFRRACNEHTWRRSLIYTRDLMRASQKLFAERAAESDFDYHQNGILVFYRTAETLEKGAAAARVLAGMDIRSEVLDAGVVRQRDPRATNQVAGAIYFPEDAHLDPPPFVEAMGRLAEKRGARIQTKTEVLALQVSGDKVSAVETTAGTFTAERIVLAAGSWSPRLADRLGLPLLIEPAKGYSLTLAGGANGCTHPVRLSDARMVVTPMSGNLRVTAKLDLVGLNLDLDERRVRNLPQLAGEYLRFKGDFSGATRWCGLRPLTPDGLPLLGPHPRAKNLILATGHGILGLGLAPITGRLIAQLIAGEQPAFDLELMRPDRFERPSR